MSETFPTVKAAALALLNLEPAPSWKEGQFLGGIICADRPLTEPQLKWVRGLLKRAELPPLAEDVE